MTHDGYEIRVATPEQIALAMDWAAGEGWNPGLNDAECYAQADPRGFLVGMLGGEVIATISAVKYQGEFAFVGFYIVHPDHRGRGYGWRLWQAAMRNLQDMNVALDGVVAQQDNYRKSGFKFAYRNVRYAGSCGGVAPDGLDLVDLRGLPFEVLQVYDEPFFPARRDDFLRAWVNQPGARALGVRLDGRLAGYGVIRPCRDGYKVGPLFADTALLANDLFLALRAGVGSGAPVFLDVPEVNAEGVALAGRHGMQASFETARMYTGEQPNLPLDRTYGVASFEIG